MQVTVRLRTLFEFDKKPMMIWIWYTLFYNLFARSILVIMIIVKVLCHNFVVKSNFLLLVCARQCVNANPNAAQKNALK